MCMCSAYLSAGPFSVWLKPSWDASNQEDLCFLCVGMKRSLPWSLLFRLTSTHNLPNKSYLVPVSQQQAKKTWHLGSHTIKITPETCMWVLVPDVGLPWWTALSLMVSIFVSPSSIRESHLNFDTNAYHLGIMTYLQPVFVALGEFSGKLKALCRSSMKKGAPTRPSPLPVSSLCPKNSPWGFLKWWGKNCGLKKSRRGQGAAEVGERREGHLPTNCHQRKPYVTIFLGGIQEAPCKAYPTCSPYRHLISRCQCPGCDSEWLIFICRRKWKPLRGRHRITDN